MKKIILLLLTFLAFSSNIYAAEKKVDPWRYEPQRRAGTDILDIIAERTVEKSVLDQVIDNTTLHDVITETEKRSAAVNVSTPAAKKAMGSSMRSRIFKSVGKGGVWGIAGSLAVEGLLEGIGWVIDEGSQVIYRYEDKENSGSVGCSGNMIENGKYYAVKWQGLGVPKEPTSCPKEAAEDYLQMRSQKDNFNYKFLRWGDETNKGKPGWSKLFYFQAPWGEDYTIVTAIKDEAAYLPQDKITMSDEQLADYMLGQATDSPQKGVHTGVNEIFKPENDYEYQNSPAVQIAKHAIDNGTVIRDETNTNTNVNPKPDGTSGFQLPSFCSWAKYVCDFVDWYKEAPEKDNEQPDQDIDDKGIFSRKFDTVFTLSKDCPPDIPFNLDAYYFQGSYTISLRWLCIIFTALGYPLMFISHCTGIWILYEAVIRKEIRAN